MTLTLSIKTTMTYVFQSRLAYEVTDAALKDQSDGLAGQMMKMTTLEEIKRLVADLIIAAADTTSTTALWTLHLLAEAPGEQQRVNTAS